MYNTMIYIERVGQPDVMIPESRIVTILINPERQEINPRDIEPPLG